MLIENFDALKLWLVDTLNPICDADPETLAKYVIALVKKDKSEEDLRDLCIRDLEVFLQHQTKYFVNKLFEALKNSAYLNVAHVVAPIPATSNDAVIKRDKYADVPLQGSNRDYKSNLRVHQTIEINYQPTPLTNQKSAKQKAAESFLHTRSKISEDDGYRRRQDTGQKSDSEMHRHSAAHDHRKNPPIRSFSPNVDRRKEPFYEQMNAGRNNNRPFDRLQTANDRDYRPRTPIRNRLGREAQISRSPGGRLEHSNQGFRQGGRRGRAGSLERKAAMYDRKMAKSNTNSPTRSPSPQRHFQPLHRPPHVHQSQMYNQHSTEQRTATVAPVARVREIRSPQVRERSRSRTGSRTKSRSADRGQIPEASCRSKSRSPLVRSRSPSLDRVSSKSSSTSLSSESSSSRRSFHDRNLPDSRSSTPLDEENSSGTKRDLGRRSPRPRCKNFDEVGYCLQGHLCQFDHGNDPVVVDRDLAHPPPMSYPGGPQPSRGQMMSSNPQPGMLPNMSRPPPPIAYAARMPPSQFLPPHGSAMLQPLPSGVMHLEPSLQSHRLLPFPSGPPPPIFRYGMPVCSDRPGDMYQRMPIPVEPYLPEPYAPKPAAYRMPPAVAHPNQEEGIDWEERDARMAQKSNRSTNLVQVHTQEGGAAVEDDQCLTGEVAVEPSKGTKRTADMAGLDCTSNAMTSSVGPSVDSLPVKKKAIEHPGVVHHGANQSQTNTTLELRKIPRDDNTIANINDHFSKFGIIVNLQICWEGDPQAALVSFASSAQAGAAYRSKEPFLNNRFIKIFWHNAEKLAQQSNQMQQMSTPALSAPSEPQPKQKHVFPQRHQLQLNNKHKKFVRPAPEKTTEVNTPVTGAAAVSGGVDAATPANDVEPANPDAPASMAALKQVQEGRPTVAPPGTNKIVRKTSKELAAKKAEITNQIRKQKQELLDKQLEQQKKLLTRLESNKATMSAEEKALIINSIKKLETIIKPLQMDLKKTVVAQPLVAAAAAKPHPAAAHGFVNKNHKFVRNPSNPGKVASPPVSAPTPKPQVANAAGIFQDKQQAQKAILDTELDLITKKDGAETSELRKRVMALKNEAGTMTAAALGLLPAGRGRGRGRGQAPSGGSHLSVPGRRGAFVRSTRTVDRRPKQLLVTGFSMDEKDELIGHFARFGEIDNSKVDESTESLLVSFKLRQNAEKAAGEGCNFKGKKLKMVWQKNVLTELNPGNTDGTEGQVVQQEASVKEAKSEESIEASALLDNDLPDLGGSNVDKQTAAISALNDSNNFASVASDDEEMDEDALLGMDEEEDDDDEEARSWRR